MECIFCRIIAREVPSSIVYEDEQIVAFRDINPQAPTHILIIPRRHIPSLADLTEADESLAGHMIMVANNLAEQEGIAERGYRVSISCGREGRQAVPHLHLHLLGGKRLTNELG